MGKEDQKNTAKAKESTQKLEHLFEGWDFEKTNYWLFAAGLIVIILGYFVMSISETNGALALTVSPILLAIGYLVLVPAALIYRKKTRESESSPNP